MIPKMTPMRECGLCIVKAGLHNCPQPVWRLMRLVDGLLKNEQDITYDPIVWGEAFGELQERMARAQSSQLLDVYIQLRTLHIATEHALKTLHLGDFLLFDESEVSR